MFFLDRDIVHSKNTLTVFYQSQSACATLTSIFFASNQILYNVISVDMSKDLVRTHPANREPPRPRGATGLRGRAGGHHRQDGEKREGERRGGLHLRLHRPQRCVGPCLADRP